MIDASAVRAELLDRDGSCRDINFTEWGTRERASAVIAFLADNFTFVRADDGEGHEHSLPSTIEFLKSQTGSLNLLWAKEEFIPHLQLYVYWLSEHGFFLELTFFPQDLDPNRFDIQAFFTLLSNLVTASGSDEYYVRYENASWKHGDVSASSGVIFSHHDGIPTGDG